MTALAQLLLVTTSLAPIGLVYAGVLGDNRKWQPAAWLTIVALLLVLLCPQMLRRVQKVVPAEPKKVADIVSKDGDSLSFLVAYALPILAVDKPTEPLVWGLAIFALIVGVTIWQQQIFHINPLLALMGYRFYAARNDAGGQVLILSRNSVLSRGVLQITLLSNYLWLEQGERKEDGGGDNGGVTSDQSGRDDSEDPR